MDNDWFALGVPAPWSDTKIAAKELLPIVLAIKLWSRALTNSQVKLYTDKEAVVTVFNETKSKDPFLMSISRDLVSVCLSENFLFRACHIPGENNPWADLLSHLQVHTR